MLSFLKVLGGKGQRGRSRQNCNYFKPRIEPLEERWCPSGIVDTWTDKGGDNLWSNPNNWSALVVPGGNDQAIFDGKLYIKTVTVDIAAAVNMLTFQNGYPGIMTLTGAGLVVNSCDLTNGGLTATLFMSDTSSSFQINTSGTFDNFKITATNGGTGVVDVASGATLTINATQMSPVACKFAIDGTLIMNNTGVVEFQRPGGITINATGSMTIEAENAVVLKNIGPGPSTGGDIINSGEIRYTGVANVTTEVDMPLSNSGDVDLTTASGVGNLKFGVTSTDTSGYAIKSTAGDVTLSNGINLSVQTGYYQTGGTFTVPDIGTLTALGTGGKAEFDGGQVLLGTSTTFGTLNISGNLSFGGGEYDPRIQGAGTGASPSDKIAVTGNVTISSSSKLVVTTLGGTSVNPGQTWDIITWTGTITGDFGTKTFPAHVSGPDPNKLHNGLYELFYV